MFQNFANYILGSILNNQEETSTVERLENTNESFRTILANDDWIVIERDSESKSENNSVENFNINIENIERDVETILTKSNSTLSLPCISNGMEESWYITPPPCFTSAGPIHMETSPLENLLIEHPSMSVYHSHSQRRHVNVILNQTNLSSNINDNELELNYQNENAAVISRPQRINKIQILKQLERQKMKNRQAQKIQILKTCQTIKRGHLELKNKAREVNSRNHRQRRGERSQGSTRSYANNNRKC